MHDDWIEWRAGIEAEVQALRNEVGSAVEEARRAIGRLDRAADFCRRMEARVEQIEANMLCAGGALVTTAADPVDVS